MSKWSKLQKELYQIIDKRIDFQLHCVSYRMNSQYGGTDLPRYFITLGKEIIFDYPKQFIKNRSDLQGYPYENEISDISCLIREYIDTPTKELLNKNFVRDKWCLTDILKAADRRIGISRLEELLLRTDCESAKKIIQKRKSI